VLADFTGVAVHDGLTSYRRYDVTHGLCGAHHLRELAGIAEATGQDWPVNLADLLCEIHKCVELAKANGATELSARRLAGYRRRYRSLITEGQRLNPPPPRTGKRGRPKLGPAGSLLRRLDEYQDDVLRFAVDFAVPLDNNQAERDVRMIKLQQEISGGWRSEQGAKAFLDGPTCPPPANTTSPPSASYDNFSPARSGYRHRRRRTLISSQLGPADLNSYSGDPNRDPVRPTRATRCAACDCVSVPAMLADSRGSEPRESSIAGHHRWATRNLNPGQQALVVLPHACL